MTNDMNWIKDGKTITAICWIAVGVIFLAVNLNYVRPEVIAQLWKLWPLIPLFIGIGTLWSAYHRTRS